MRRQTGEHGRCVVQGLELNGRRTANEDGEDGHQVAREHDKEDEGDGQAEEVGAKQRDGHCDQVEAGAVEHFPPVALWQTENK